MSASPSRVAVFGAGYVGLVTGACFAELGHSVVVRDVIPERIAALQRGEVPIYEPGLEELIARNGERLRFTGDVGEAIDGADFVYIAVGTPPTYSGDADLSAVWTVIDELPAIDRRCVVVMKSTVPVGTGLKVRHRLDERGLRQVGYASNPEFTAEGTAVKDFLHPDRIVVGAFSDEDGDAVAGLHAGIEAPVVRCDVASAEMIKLAANAALMTRISFINEIANVCEATGADVVRVAEGIGLDRRIGPSFLRAGIGFGGSCFPKDSLALEAIGSELGLPLPAAQRRDRGERAAEAPRDRQAPQPSRLAAEQADRAARARVQAAHRRHAGGAEPRPRGQAAGRGGGRGRVGSRRRRARPARRRDRRHAGGGGARRRRGRDRDRVATARRRRLGVGGRDDAHPRADRRSQHARPASRFARPGSRSRASGARPSPGSPDGGDRPRRRQGRADGGRNGGPAEVARRGRREAAARLADRAAAPGRRRSRDHQLLGRPGAGLRGRACRPRSRDRLRRRDRAARPRRRDPVRRRHRAARAATSSR